MDADIIYTASTWVAPILMAITLHEAAHAYAAWKLGDDTAFRLGRVTSNPLKHVDLFGTVLLPALLFLTKAPFLFGWAKPVPVALAGPATNMILALVSAALIQLVWLVPQPAVPWLVQTLYQSILLNLILAIFNMIPIPPLDGSRIALSLLPEPLARPYARLERYGFLILLGIILVLPMLGRQIGVDLNVFRWVVGVPLAWIMPLFVSLTGVE